MRIFDKSNKLNTLNVKISLVPGWWRFRDGRQDGAHRRRRPHHLLHPPLSHSRRSCRTSSTITIQSWTFSRISFTFKLIVDPEPWRDWPRCWRPKNWDSKLFSLSSYRFWRPSWTRIPTWSIRTFSSMNASNPWSRYANRRRGVFTTRRWWLIWSVSSFRAPKAESL